jgi:hypothetical protein
LLSAWRRRWNVQSWYIAEHTKQSPTAPPAAIEIFSVASVPPLSGAVGSGGSNDCDGKSEGAGEGRLVGFGVGLGLGLRVRATTAETRTAVALLRPLVTVDAKDAVERAALTEAAKATAEVVVLSLATLKVTSHVKVEVSARASCHGALSSDGTPARVALSGAPLLEAAAAAVSTFTIAAATTSASVAATSRRRRMTVLEIAKFLTLAVPTPVALAT